MRLRLVTVVLVSMCSLASADVDRELRRLADRVAPWATPAGLAPLVEEHVLAGDVAGLADVVARTRKSGFGPAIEAGWRAAAYGGAGDRARVEQLAREVEAAIAKQADGLDDSARCAVALGFEYLRDHAAADRWRKQATGFHGWCRERLPVLAARRGDHDRVAALLADVRPSASRIDLLLAIAGAYAETAQTARIAPLVEEAAAALATSSSADPASVPKIAEGWAAAGQRAKARAAAKRALAAFDASAREEPMLLVIHGEDVAAALAAAGERSALAKLIARIEKEHAKNKRVSARAETASLVARFGPKARAKALVAAAAGHVDDQEIDLGVVRARYVLIDAYLALGDIAGAIDQARNTTATLPIEIEALTKIARHCRLTRCARTRAVGAALARVAADLETYERNK